MWGGPEVEHERWWVPVHNPWWFFYTPEHFIAHMGGFIF